jgi:hypothetical protein
MPMREDCRHFESRTYGDDGEVARFCTLDLAPEAPWRCPENCPKYERSLIDKTFEPGALERSEVEPEPDEDPQAIADLLDDAEDIVNAVQADALAELDEQKRPRRWWQRRKRGDDGPFRLSQR